MSLFYFVLQRTGSVLCQLPCSTESAESITWSLKMFIKLLILHFGLRLFGGLHQFAVSRCFRFPVMLASLIQCENTLLLLAGCNLSTICMAADFWCVFLTATCLWCRVSQESPWSKSRQQEQVFITISLYETLLTAEVFFCTQHCPSFYLPPDTAWLQGRSTESSYHHYVGAGDWCRRQGKSTS